MKQVFITRSGSRRLLLFFAGWGMDATPFRQWQTPGYDLMICYDYRQPAFDATLLQDYAEIRLLAWSMGVWAAAQTLSKLPQLPLTRCFATNGTPLPIDQIQGIAPAIFAGTLRGLDEQTLQKFQRRMCGSATAYERFRSVAPQRSVEELREELAVIGERSLVHAPAAFTWHKAFVGREDRIFLPANQNLAWEERGVAIVETDAPHYDEELFQHIVEQLIEDSWTND